MGFQRMLGLVCSECLPSGLHGCEESALSIASSGTLGSAVARVVWPRSFPCQILRPSSAFWMHHHVLTQLSMLFGAAFARCGGTLLAGLTRKGGFVRLFDFAAAGSPGHGAVHLLSSSALEIFLPGILSRKGGFGLAFRLYA